MRPGRHEHVSLTRAVYASRSYMRTYVRTYDARRVNSLARDEHVRRRLFSIVLQPDLSESLSIIDRPRKPNANEIKTTYMDFYDEIN